jgi:hypothetical protein
MLSTYCLLIVARMERLYNCCGAGRNRKMRDWFTPVQLKSLSRVQTAIANDLLSSEHQFRLWLFGNPFPGHDGADVRNRTFLRSKAVQYPAL